MSIPYLSFYILSPRIHRQGKCRQISAGNQFIQSVLRSTWSLFYLPTKLSTYQDSGFIRNGFFKANIGNFPIFSGAGSFPSEGAFLCWPGWKLRHKAHWKCYKWEIFRQYGQEIGNGVDNGIGGCYNIVVFTA